MALIKYGSGSWKNAPSFWNAETERTLMDLRRQGKTYQQISDAFQGKVSVGSVSGKICYMKRAEKRSSPPANHPDALALDRRDSSGRPREVGGDAANDKI